MTKVQNINVDGKINVSILWKYRWVWSLLQLLVNDQSNEIYNTYTIKINYQVLNDSGVGMWDKVQKNRSTKL